MIVIYWHCFSMTETDERFLRSTLEELAQNLKAEPIKLTITIKPLEDEPELSKKISERLNKLKDQSYTLCNCDYDIARVLMHSVRLFVYCRPDNYIADAARRAENAARWGITPTARGSFSVAYPPRDRDRLKSKFTIWHETVHLLLQKNDDSNDECYEPHPPYPKKADCNCDTCIMQYEPNGKWDGKLSMCDKIIGFFEELSRKCKQNK